MNLVLFTHPEFLSQQSMPRYAKMIQDGMIKRGHTVEIWTPTSRVYKLPFGKSFKKWLGYVDQFLIFPFEVKNRLKKLPVDTLFVFTDHALGPWVPLVKNRLQIIHCHDFLAQHSALGTVPENRTSWTGRLYQKIIRKGYVKGRNFISVSQNTRYDLHKFLSRVPKISEVVYNGLNQCFECGDVYVAREHFSTLINRDLSQGYLLHIGGNNWYKNRGGVIEIYCGWRKDSKYKLPLLLVGSSPSKSLIDQRNESPYKNDIFFLNDIDDNGLKLAYHGASLFLFPSLAEGFGWPIAEAMASGCPVLTTNRAPMTEVAGTAAFLIPRMPADPGLVKDWVCKAREVIDLVLNLDTEERNKIVSSGLINALRFNTEYALDKIENIYLEVIQGQKLKGKETSTHSKIALTPQENYKGPFVIPIILVCIFGIEMIEFSCRIF
ncbi:MAG: glycosyltransferase [Chitinophagaceae bacterium]|nr:glycosyltransferase [Chitinophagaceae bacterium]